MTVDPKPPAEANIDSSLVRRLLREQHPDLASLDLVDIGEGWDNRVFRLGEDLAVRLPRRASSTVLVEQEQRWLPELRTRLPVPIPAPVRTGRPGCGFPWPWSVTPWMTGESAMSAHWDFVPMAVALGRFLRALHQPAPAEAPHNAWRGVPLVERDEVVRRHVEQLGTIVDRDAVLTAWHRALATPPWTGPALWIHGDLHPGNLLVIRGRLSAVIDFGDLTAGDPATDLSTAWMMLPPEARPQFLSAARSPFNPVDEHTYNRARGWALTLGLSWLASSRGDDAMRAIGSRAIGAALERDDAAG